MSRSGLYSGNSIRCELAAEDIAHLIIDVDGESVNKLTRVVMEQFGLALDSIEAHPDIRGLVISSAKPVLSVGADLNEFLSLNTRKHLEEFLHRGEVFARIRSLPFPTATAIPGTAVGGGLEMALACNYRVAAEGTYALGLPDIRLGVIPSWGGSVLLPRVVGIDSAIQMICYCKFQSPQQALKIRLVDELAPADRLIDTAISRLQTSINSGDWREINERKRAPGALSDAEHAVIGEARRKVRIAAFGFPAPARALDVIASSADEPLESAFELEREVTISLSRDPRCIVPGAVGLFFLAKLLGAGGRRRQKWRELMRNAPGRMRLNMIIGILYIAVASLAGRIVQLFSRLGFRSGESV